MIVGRVLRLGGSTAHWAERGNVVTATTASCELLVSGLARPHGIALSSTHVYWTTPGDGRVWRMAKP